MILEGIKLMILGISMVFLFLMLLNIGINVMGRLFKGEAERELNEAAAEQAKMAADAAKKAKAKSASNSDNGIITAVISAAIAKFKAEKA